MKMTTNTFNRLEDQIGSLDTEDRREAYRSGNFPRADRVKDLDVRYRWDLFYAAGGHRLIDPEENLTSDHIDTALRRIVPALGK